MYFKNGLCGLIKAFDSNRTASPQSPGCAPGVEYFPRSPELRHYHNLQMTTKQ
jgi:hypothetical protein